jgi:hypothetical protein
MAQLPPLLFLVLPFFFAESGMFFVGAEKVTVSVSGLSFEGGSMVGEAASGRKVKKLFLRLVPLNRAGDQQGPTAELPLTKKTGASKTYQANFLNYF